MRWARAIRCSSTAGFQGRSTLITVLAACRFRPDRAGVGGQKQPAVGVGLESVHQFLRAAFAGTLPSSRTNSSFRFLSSGSIRSSIVVHSENSTTLRPSSSNNPLEQTRPGRSSLLE